MLSGDFVLDASVTLSWAFEDELTALADVVLARLKTNKAVVPPIWSFEVTNGLIVAERKGRISPKDATEFLRTLRVLPILSDPVLFEPDLEDLAKLARESGLSVYDASYLFLARLRRIPLATLDKSLSQAARFYGVPVLP